MRKRKVPTGGCLLSSLLVVTLAAGGLPVSVHGAEQWEEDIYYSEEIFMDGAADVSEEVLAGTEGVQSGYDSGEAGEIFTDDFSAGSEEILQGTSNGEPFYEENDSEVWIPSGLSGSGTEADPYLVKDGNDLPGEIPEGICYALANDITVASGRRIENLAGILDGKGHVITLADTALAGTVSGIIRNVGVAGSMASVNSEEPQGVLASVLSGTIENCYCLAAFTEGEMQETGGFAGMLQGGTIRNSYINTSMMTGYCGAFVGTAQGTGTVSNACWGPSGDGIAASTAPAVLENVQCFTLEGFRTQAAVDVLNTARNDTGYVWILPEEGINDGFPVLAEAANVEPMLQEEIPENTENAQVQEEASEQKDFGDGESAGDQLLTGESRASANAAEALKNAENYLTAHVTSPGFSVTNGEWSVMAMARNGVLTDAVKNAYLGNLYQVLDTTQGVLSTDTYTDYSRVVLALGSIGVSPLDVNGYDLLYPLSDYERVCYQGINGSFFALIAADSGAYEFPELTDEDVQAGKIQTTRELLIQTILEAQCSDGGWTLSGSVGDPDMTAMAIQALAPYYGTREDVSGAVDNGLACLSAMQKSDGAFGSPKSAESCAQVLIALCAVDAGLIESADFVKNGNSVVDAILRFQKTDGGFSHLLAATESEGMATDQGTLALEAFRRAGSGENFLYDMTDIINPGGEETPENIQAFKDQLNALPDPVTLEDKEQVYQLLAQLNQMGTFSEKKQLQKQLRKLQELLKEQENTVAQLDQDIWDMIQPLKITLADKETIEALTERYEALPEKNRAYVENWKDVETARAIVEKLEKGYIGKEIFVNVVNSGKDYIYESSGYSIILKGSRSYEARDMNAVLEIQEKKSSLTFQTAASGKLPGQIDVKVQCGLENGAYILYRQSGTEKKALGWMGVDQGSTTLTIDTGGSYLLEKPEMDLTQEAGGQTSGQEESRLSGTMNGTSATARNSQTSSGGNTSGSGTRTTAGTTSRSKVSEAEVKDGIVDKAQLEKIKGQDLTLTIKGKTEEDKEYQLSINGNDIKNAKDMNVVMKTVSDKAEDIRKLSEEPSIYSFSQKGDFPGEIMAEVSIDKEDGEYLLFFFNADERKAEFKQKVTVKDKTTRFLLSSGGDYFIAERAKVRSLNEIEEEEREEAEAEKIKEKTKEESKEIPETQTEDELLAGTMEPEAAAGIPGIWIVVIVIVTAAVLAAGAVFIIKKKQRRS